MVRAAQDLEVQQSGHLVIVEELGRGGDVAKHVLALSALADFPEVVVALVGEQVLAEFEHGGPQARCTPRREAAARMALMMGS